jgi:hypothetical protein
VRSLIEEILQKNPDLAKGKSEEALADYLFNIILSRLIEGGTEWDPVQRMDVRKFVAQYIAKLKREGRYGLEDLLEA